MENLAPIAAVVVVGDVHRKRVFGGFVHVDGEGDLSIAETSNLVKRE